MKNSRIWLTGIVVIALAIYFISRDWRGKHSVDSDKVQIRYGVTPFQDSVLPIVAGKYGWYKRDGLEVNLINLGWSDVPLALASKSIDVAIYNVDSYMAASEQLSKGGVDVVFYAPLYVWNGAAIMIHGDKGIRPAGDLADLPIQERKAAVKAAVEQLRGKKVGVTQGTTFEQTVLDALRVAGMDPKRDVKIIYARPEDNLAAFLAGDLDAFSAGLTERVQAKRHGATELIIGPDVSLPAIDGIIVRRDFAEQHPKEIQSLVSLWFETIRYIQVDVESRSGVVRDYLRGRASVDYSSEEYAIAWKFQYFPDSREAAVKTFLDPASVYFWKPIWDENSQSLIAQKKLTNAISEDGFWGARTLTAH